MQAKAVHEAVKALLGRSVSWSSIRGTLADRVDGFVASVRADRPREGRADVRCLPSALGRSAREPGWASGGVVLGAREVASGSLNRQATVCAGHRHPHRAPDSPGHPILPRCCPMPQHDRYGDSIERRVRRKFCEALDVDYTAKIILID